MVSAVTAVSAFSASGGMLSGPGAFFPIPQLNRTVSILFLCLPHQTVSRFVIDLHHIGHENALVD